MVPEAEFRSYYDRPVLKEPVWSWEVPAYFFAGGLAAGSAMLAAAADLLGRPDLARRGRIAAAAGAAVGGGLLVADLGRPARFLNMLRVAKPTSPMSVGSWVLTLFGPAAGAAALSDVLGVFPRIGRVAGLAAGALGPPLASYTAVLLADTAVPVWHESGRELPFLFVGGASATSGALSVMLTPVGEAAPARRLCTARRRDGDGRGARHGTQPARGGRPALPHRPGGDPHEGCLWTDRSRGGAPLDLGAPSTCWRAGGRGVGDGGSVGRALRGRGRRTGLCARPGSHDRPAATARPCRTSRAVARTTDQASKSIRSPCV